MAKILRKVLGTLLIITAIVLTQIPMPGAFAANAVEDFQMNEDTLVEYTGTATVVSVPDDVKKIGEEAFAKNLDIGSVHVGKNTEEISFSAFAGCKYLTSITISDHVEVVDDYAFSGCEYLSTVKIGAGVKKIGNGVFAGCNSLANIQIDHDNTNFVMEKGALYDEKQETLLAYLNGYEADTYNMPHTVKEITPYSFWGNDTLEYIDLSNYLQEIPGYAFSNCSGLKNITIPYSVDTIDAKAFENCVSLTDVVIPASVSYIDPTAFDGCRKLNIIADKGTAGYEFYQEFLARSAAEQVEKEEIFAPGTSFDSLQSDGVVSNTGGNDSNTVNAMNDPSNVDYMPSSDPLATNEDSSVKAKTLVVGGNAILFIDSSDVSVYGGNQGNNQENSVTVESNFASNNTAVVKPQAEIIYDQAKGGYLPKYAVLEDKIASQGFYGDSTLSSYTIPSGITSIGEFAFARSSIRNVEIPEGVTTIEYGAFYHCDQLTDVSIPSSVTKIEGYAFQNTPFLDHFFENDSNPYLIVGDGILLAYNGKNVEVTIPEGVKQIAPGCFMNHTEIAAVTLPNSLKVIAEDAFNGCTDLTTVSGGKQVTEIHDRAFLNCPLKDFVFPESLAEIGLRAIDFSDTDKEENTKVVAFSSKELPGISVGEDSKRLSNVSYRDDSLKDVKVVVVPNDCDDYEGSVLDSSLPGFSGLVVGIDRDGNVQVKACLASSTEALLALPDSFLFDGKEYSLPIADYKMTANRQTTDLSREVKVNYNGTDVDFVTASFSGEEMVGTLSIVEDGEAQKRIETAYKELFGDELPDMKGYVIELTDVSGYIPITQFGNSELTITMPIPEELEGNRFRVLCLDEDGQLEEVNSLTKGGTIRFTTTHLSDYAIYGTGDKVVSLTLEEGKIIPNFKKDESPDTGDNSLPVNFVFALGVALIGVSMLLYRKKKY